MQDGQISKDMLYGKLSTGFRPTGRPVFHFKDVCKGDIKAGNINAAGWEALAADYSSWRLVIKAGIQTSEQRRED